MKTFKFLMMAALIGIFSGQVLAEKDEFTKKISKSFDVNKDALLTIENKFGKIQCVNWDRNNISIEVTITVDASTQDKANKIFDKIGIEISGTSSQVTARTDLGDNMFNKNDNDLSIDYLISMPKTVSIDLDNKFGDILVDVVTGSAKIELGYGTIKCKSLEGNTNDLDIKFSEGSINYIKSSSVHIQYTDLNINEAGDMTADSKFSDFDIGSIDVLTLKSGYDDDQIGQVRDIDVHASFSDMEIQSLGERIVADFDYGGLKIKETGKNFKLIDLTNSFSDANIGFYNDASFRLSATIKMGDISYPRDKARLSVVDVSYTSSKYEGVIGDNQDTVSKVVIDSKNSGVTLYYR